MSAPESMKKLIGSWTGTSSLWRPWLAPQNSDSSSRSSVTLATQGKVVVIEYTWSVDDKPQDGLLLISSENTDDAVKAVWTDSWHLSDKFLTCDGSIDSNGAINILGSYAAPSGPDWGWRTVVEPGKDNSFEIVMYNISPEGEEMLAFRNRYERQI